MKVLIVTETLNEGGAELFLLRLARGLIKAGVEVQVVSLNSRFENKDMTDLYRDVPIKRFSLPFFPVIEFFDKAILRLGIDFSLRYFLQGRQLKKLSEGFDIIHSHYIQVDYLITAIRKEITCRHIVTVHGDYSSQYDSYRKGELRLWLRLDKKLKQLSKYVEQWVVLSEEQRNFLKEKMTIPGDKIRKVYNGGYAYETSINQENDNGIFTIGMVARGTQQKGWQLLIDTFLRLPANCNLLLVGGGEYLDRLKSNYSEEKRILFTGFQADTVSMMRHMDVFVLPTFYPFESLPNVISEALQCGLPVVATDVGEIRQMITDAETGNEAGFVIKTKDQQPDAEELYDRLKYLYDHPDERMKMAVIAKAASKKFDMEKCIAAYQQLYRELLSLNFSEM